jgi:hypothetical protein
MEDRAAENNRKIVLLASSSAGGVKPLCSLTAPAVFGTA